VHVFEALVAGLGQGLRRGRIYTVTKYRSKFIDACSTCCDSALKAIGVVYTVVLPCLVACEWTGQMLHISSMRPNNTVAPCCVSLAVGAVCQMSIGVYDVKLTVAHRVAGIAATRLPCQCFALLLRVAVVGPLTGIFIAELVQTGQIPSTTCPPQNWCSVPI
jgi:hypothetical protein